MFLAAKIVLTLIVAYYVIQDLRSLTPEVAHHAGPRIVAKVGLLLVALAACLLGVWLSNGPVSVGQGVGLGG